MTTTLTWQVCTEPDHFLIDSECVPCEERVENSKSQVPIIVTIFFFVLIISWQCWQNSPRCIREPIQRVISFLDDARQSSFGASFKICAGFYQVCAIGSLSRCGK